jgi:hypothetical protein
MAKPNKETKAGANKIGLKPDGMIVLIFTGVLVEFWLSWRTA